MEDTRAGMSERWMGALAVECKYGDGWALEVVEMEGDVASKLSHSSLQ